MHKVSTFASNITALNQSSCDDKNNNSALNQGVCTMIAIVLAQL